MGGAYLHHSGIIATALFRALRASLLEEAMLRHIHGVRNVAGDIKERVAVRIHSRL